MLAFGVAGIQGPVLSVRVYVRVLEALPVYPLVLPFGLCVCVSVRVHVRAGVDVRARLCILFCRAACMFTWACDDRKLV